MSRSQSQSQSLSQAASATATPIIPGYSPPPLPLALDGSVAGAAAAASAIRSSAVGVTDSVSVTFDSAVSEAGIEPATSGPPEVPLPPQNHLREGAVRLSNILGRHSTCISEFFLFSIIVYMVGFWLFCICCFVVHGKRNLIIHNNNNAQIAGVLFGAGCACCLWTGAVHAVLC